MVSRSFGFSHEEGEEVTQIILKSTIDVEYVDHMGSDLRCAHAAWVSTKGLLVEAQNLEKVRGVLKFLMDKRHGSPFECGALTVRVHAPIKVWREWMRHRVGWCLAGDSRITLGNWARNLPISEIYRNWHKGISDSRPFKLGQGVCWDSQTKTWKVQVTQDGKTKSLGRFSSKEGAVEIRKRWEESHPTFRTRMLTSCKNLKTRVLNEETLFFETGRMQDVVESGVKELLQIATVAGHSLKCSKDHKILTNDGWVSAGELRRGDRIAVVGRRSKFAERQIPPSLRSGIGVWTSMQRNRLIKEEDCCYLCGTEHIRSVLVLDHVVPVVTDLTKALDVNNLKPICPVCDKIKTAGEQKLAQRCNVAGAKFAKLSETPRICSEEMTYDISMEGPHHNFVANNIVVHNSYNEQSGRYMQLEPVFWMPPRERAMIKVEEFKPSSPQFRVATEEDYETIRYNLEDGYNESYNRYECLLAEQCDPGLSRDVLGVGIFSACYVTCNPRSLMHFLELRTKRPDAKRPSSPLWEIDNAAQQLEVIFKERWPLIHELWDANGRMAP